MSTAPKWKLTEAEYLEIERKAEFKSEFFNGEMFPMQGPGGPYGLSGARFPHNRIKENLVGELHRLFKGGPCQTLSSDMRVRVSPTGLYTYPDLVIVGDPPEFADEKQDALLNPQVIIEVLSDSTEAYDRGAKFRQYEHLPSLREYVLVEQDEPVVERFVRRPDGSWVLTTVTGLAGTFALATVPLADVYAGVTLPESPRRGPAARTAP